MVVGCFFVLFSVFYFFLEGCGRNQTHPCIALCGHSFKADGTVIAGQKRNIWKNTLVIFLLVLTAFEFLLNDFGTN